MPESITTKHLLTSIGYGTTTPEVEIIRVLYNKFGVRADEDLAVNLKDVDPVEVLVAILDTLKPFAMMVEEIYEFIADSTLRLESNISVRIPPEKAHGLHLDPERYAHSEVEVVRKVRRAADGYDIDFMRLPKSDGSWCDVGVAADFCWLPRCLQDNPLQGGTPCANCRGPSTAASDYKFLFACLGTMTKIAREQKQLSALRQLPLPEGLSWNGVFDLVDMLRKREGKPNGWGSCPQEFEGGTRWFTKTVAELREAQRWVEVDDIRHFLSLPYWEHRWQLYEVWFVTILLRSFSISNLKFSLEGNCWPLNVGGTMDRPIAISQLADGRIVEFYYQHQGIPPSALSRHHQDRPEVMVRVRGSSGGAPEILLVAELKARDSIDYSGLEGAVYPLLKWRPSLIIGANYFDIGEPNPVMEVAVGETNIWVGTPCAPGTPAETALSAKLRSFWTATLGEIVTIVLVDTSGSMDVEQLQKAVQLLLPQWVSTSSSRSIYATFSDSFRMCTAEELQRGDVLLPDGGSAVSAALVACQALLDSQASASQIALHLLTDLGLADDELGQLERFIRSKKGTFRIYAWPCDEVTHAKDEFPFLERFIHLLPVDRDQ